MTHAVGRRGVVSVEARRRTPTTKRMMASALSPMMPATSLEVGPDDVCPPPAPPCGVVLALGLGEAVAATDGVAVAFGAGTMESGAAASSAGANLVDPLVEATMRYQGPVFVVGSVHVVLMEPPFCELNDAHPLIFPCLSSPTLGVPLSVR